MSMPDLTSIAPQWVATECACPGCKRAGKLQVAPVEVRFEYIICDFCGFVGQVKAVTSDAISEPPALVAGSDWETQRDRIKQSVYFPLFLVVAKPDRTKFAIYFLSPDGQRPEMFQPNGEGGAGFLCDLALVRSSIVRIY